MHKKILITDYDGTLALSNGTVSEHTSAVIREFVRLGGTFVVCTGRMKTSIFPIAKSITGSGYVIAFNGAEISDLGTGKDVVYTPIDNATAVEALGIICKTGVYVQAYYDGKIIIDKRTQLTGPYESICGVKATEVNENLCEHFRKTGHSTAKLLVYDEPEKVDKAYEEIYSRLGDKLKVVRSNPNHIEITEKHVSKGNAVKKLLDILSRPLNEDVITVGDSGNDISMLENFPSSFAVNNAYDGVKKIAKCVLPVTNDERAIEYIIEHYCK